MTWALVTAAWVMLFPTACFSKMRQIDAGGEGEVMDFADVFNALSLIMDGTNWHIEGIEAHPNLKGFNKQETESSLFPIEYVKQSGCGDYGYHGTVYFPTTYPNGDGGVMHVRVDYND